MHTLMKILICTQRKFFRKQSTFYVFKNFSFFLNNDVSYPFLLSFVEISSSKAHICEDNFQKGEHTKKNLLFLNHQTFHQAKEKLLCREQAKGKNAEAKSLISASIRKGCVKGNSSLESEVSGEKKKKIEKLLLGLEESGKKFVTEIEIKCLIVCLQAED
jgi:hypothetical protein